MDQTLKFVIEATLNGSGFKDASGMLKDLQGMAAGAGAGLASLYSSLKSDVAIKRTTSALDGLGISTAALTDPSYALGAALKYSIDQAAEAEKIMAQTEAVIRSTGGAAGLSAEEIASMSGALSQVSTFSDDAVQKGANLLLTFTGIGKDVFPDATKAMLDMATAMGTDASGGAIQLGKALNDPTAGITALTRVGVVFTDEQKNLIKSLQDSGDMAGAQRVILAELNKEFGGSAAAAVDTYSGRLTLLQHNVDNLAEAFGGVLIPVLSEAAGAANTLITWNDKMRNALDEQNTRVAETAATYEEYIGTLKESAVNAGYAINAQGDLTETQYHGGIAIDVLTQKNYALTESEFNAAQAAEDLEASTKKATYGYEEFSAAAYMADRNAYEVAKAQRDAAHASLELKMAQSELAAIIAGAVGNENAAYAESQAEVTASLEEERAKLEELKAANGRQVTVVTEATNSQAEYELAVQKATKAQQALAENTDPEKAAALQVAYEKAAAGADKMAAGMGGSTSATVDNNAAIAEQQAIVDGLNSKYAENARAHEEATARIVFGYIQQAYAADGLSLAEIDALAKIGKEWGIYDEATATAVTSATQAVRDHGTDVAGILSDMNAAVEGLPTYKSFEYTITWNAAALRALQAEMNALPGEINGTVGGATGDGYDDPTDAQGATGLHMAVPPGYPDDSFRVGVQTGEVVDVWRSPSERAAAMGGGGVHITNYISDHRAMAMEHERQRRLTAEYADSLMG